MNTLITVQRVSRAMYSTEITQDFLKDLLERAKKATTLPNNTKPIKHINNYNKSKFNSNRQFIKGQKQSQKKFVNSKNLNRKNNNSNSHSEVGFYPMTSNVSEETILSNLPKQPQFQRTGKHINEMNIDLLDVLDNTGNDRFVSKDNNNNKDNNNHKKFSNTRKLTLQNNRNRYRNKTNKSGFIYRKPISPTVNKNLVKSQTFPETFELNKINPNSLFKYYPSLNVNTKTRWINFILYSMNEANFPLYREPNVSYASLIKDQIEGPIKPNDIFTVKTPGFGKYIYENSYSVKLEREPLVENINVTLNKDKFNEMVLGEYKSMDIEPDSSSSSHETRVRLSLQQCAGLSDDDKRWLYQVCSGAIPLNQVNI